MTMKKLLAVILSLVLSLSLLAACASDEDLDTQTAPENEPPVIDEPESEPEAEDIPEEVAFQIPDGYIAYADFDNGTAMGFSMRGSSAEQASGVVGVMEVSQDVARSGSYSLFVSGRQHAWNGPAYRIEELIEQGVQYNISVWVYAKAPDSSDYILSTQIGDGDGAQYINLERKRVSKDDGWVEFTAQYSYGSVGDFITIYVENNTSEAEFYIDDFTVTVDEVAAAWDPATDMITNNWIGEFEGFDVEFWSQNAGDAGFMTLTGGGTFWCSWDGFNQLFRTGKKLGSVATYDEYGDVIIEYEASHEITRGDVSYLTVYGWTEDPLMEWYIVENRGSYRPGKDFAGTIEVDGAAYDVYTDLRVEQPSIQGTATFPQIYSIRQENRTEGTITVSDHFKAWEELGLEVSGNLFEVTMCVEGFNGAGQATLKKLVLTIGDDVYGTPDDRRG